ncbi:hypothetical protein L1049_007892 [Liquidambar formosana]|uniref:SAM domain-containing protein n=1 Tax=Liquidambar formosana TaxID=63359 RepID=A0AAP0X7W5_LIQFO
MTNERDPLALPPKKNVQIDSAQPISKLAKQPRLDFMMELEFPGRVGTLKSRKLLGAFSTVKSVEQPKLYNGSTSFIDGGVLLNQGLRASNLERKIRRAGGLSRWLVSLGLEQFVRIFRGKSVNKFQLVNLTMKKLKDMGADAVGPRRKLMHAIDCLCQPYCFKAV